MLRFSRRCFAKASRQWLLTAGLLLMHSSTGYPAPFSGPGQNPRNFSNVVGGEEVTPGTFPWLVTVLAGNRFCGGTLIHPYWVLTAAHCVVGATPGSIRAVIGDIDLNLFNPPFIGADQIVVHPGFSAAALGDDIALIKLSRAATTPPIEVGREFVVAEDLPDGKAEVAGYGSTEAAPASLDGIVEPAFLARHVRVPLVDNAVCASKYESSNITIDDRLMCAGDIENGGVDACSGDSGGPLFVELPVASPAGEEPRKFVQLGITSFGLGCAQAEYPGVYTRLSEYADWIDANMFSTLHYAQFGNGQGFSSDVVIVNNSTTQTNSGELTFWDPEGNRIDPSTLTGEPMPAGSNPNGINFVLPPLGSLTFSTSGVGALQSGSVTLTTSGELGGIIRFSFPGLGIAGISESEPLASAIVPVRREEPLSTGVAIRNVADEDVSVELTLKSEDGSTVAGGTAEVILPPGGRDARFIEQIFPDADTAAFHGTVCVVANNGRIALTAIELGADQGQFTTLRVISLD